MAKTVRMVGLICAAGVGKRMGLTIPKQYMTLTDKPMLVETVNALAREERLDEVIVVVAPDDAYIDTVAPAFPAGVRVLRVGGKERADSVLNGLTAAGFADDDWVLVHDAARPCVRPSETALLIDTVLGDETVAGAILAVPLADTLKLAGPDRCIEKTVPRKNLWRAATPQMFKAGDLRRALSGDLTGITDEASAIERLGLPVKLVPCRSSNLKVTEPADGTLARLLLGDKNMVPFRIGQGYDTHRLVEGRPLVLGGVTIPFDKGLDGHSDADVLLHAIIDAVLGAAGLGDIGRHFPPTDPQYKGIDSRKLLTAVMKLARQEGWEIVNCDATLVAERPKIAPYAAQIVASVAQTLGCSVSQVSVKAKTNEKMDDVGRQAGMMAQAVVLLTKVSA